VNNRAADHLSLCTLPKAALARAIFDGSLREQTDELSMEYANSEVHLELLIAVGF
jgi:hypothetical protein